MVACAVRSPAPLDEIVAHAVRDAPKRVLRPRRRPRRHAVAARGRTSRRARFASIDGRELIPAEVAFEDDGDELSAIYHSHTRSEPYPSQTDVNFAAGWPGVEWLIVGVRRTPSRPCAPTSSTTASSEIERRGRREPRLSRSSARAAPSRTRSTSASAARAGCRSSTPGARRRRTGQRAPRARAQDQAAVHRGRARPGRRRPEPGGGRVHPGLLLEEGIPSTLRRTRGFDVPDMLAAGPRDVMVPASGLAAAREVLLQAEMLRLQAGPAAAPSRACSAFCLASWSSSASWSGWAPKSSPFTHGPSQARRLGPRGLGHRARLVADLLGRRRARADRGVHARGVRRRHHVLRHRQRLRPRRGRERVGRDPRRLPARLVHARDEGLLPDGRRATAACRASRSTSRSTPRWSGCRPTTSTSTSATATTTTRRSRRRCRR